MKNLTILFKALTGLTAVIPGLSYFKKDIYPINISAGLLIVICEVIGGIIILTALRNDGQIKRLAEKRKFRITLISIVGGLVLFVSFAIFAVQKVTFSRDKSPYLLPLFDCCPEYAELNQTANAQGENIAEHLGVDKLTRIINNNCAYSGFLSKAVFFAFIIVLYSTIVFTFIFLGLSLKTSDRRLVRSL